MSALLVGLLIGGCAEFDAMPTRPVPPQANPSDWRLIYPVTTNRNLNAAWGMSADDMWAVGAEGTILHYDGQTVSLHDPPIMENLVAIDGCSRDEIWAVAARGDVLRWDGRRWTVAVRLAGQLRAVHCAGPGEVYVGGSASWLGERYSAIWHHDGGDWTRVLLMNSSNAIQKIWRPGPGMPLMAASSELFFLVDGHWHQTTMEASFQTACEDIIVTRDPGAGFGGGSAIYRMHPGVSMTRVCEDHWFRSFRRVVRSREPLLAASREIMPLRGCMLGGPVELPFWINDLAVPVLSGSDGRHVFAAGDAGGFAHLIWQTDRQLSAEYILSRDENSRVRAVVGDGDSLFLLDMDGRVLRGGSGTWQHLETPFSVRAIEMTNDGTLAIGNGSSSPWRCAFLANDGAWQEIPPFESGTSWGLYSWIGQQRQVRIVVRSSATNRWEMWGFDGTAWSRIYDLHEEMDSDDISPVSLDGVGPDDLYLHIHVAGSRRLLHHDGHSLRRVMEDLDLDIARMSVGRTTGRVYIEAREGWEPVFGAFLEDGVLTELDNAVSWNRLWEVSEDLVFCVGSSRAHQLQSGCWIEMSFPGFHHLNDLWGHLEQGLFVINDRQVFHRDLPGGSS